MPKKLSLPTQGEMLREEFLRPMSITPYRLAKDIAVPQTRISAILSGARRITADTGLRLDRYFGLSEGWWSRLQTDCDLRKAKRKFGARISREVVDLHARLISYQPTAFTAEQARAVHEENRGDR